MGGKKDNIGKEEPKDNFVEGEQDTPSANDGQDNSINTNEEHNSSDIESQAINAEQENPSEKSFAENQIGNTANQNLGDEQEIESPELETSNEASIAKNQESAFEKEGKTDNSSRAGIFEETNLEASNKQEEESEKGALAIVKQIFWSNKWFALLINLVFVGGFISFLIYYFFYVYLPDTTNYGETITVPDLRGKTVEELPQYLDAMELRYEVADSAYDPEVPPLAILDQYPEKERQVKLNRKIYLTINKVAPPVVKFPNIIDSSIESAERILQSVGLKLGKIKFVPDDIPNTVLGVIIDEEEIEREQIAEGYEIPKGTSVDLEVGSGLRENQRTVPEVIGMPIEEAEIYLNAYGLAVGHIEYYDTLGVVMGTVIMQNPNAEKGKVIAVGSMVDLWVSGPYPESLIDK